jgi:hypothetical protein
MLIPPPPKFEANKDKPEKKILKQLTPYDAKYKREKLQYYRPEVNSDTEQYHKRPMS